MVTAVTDEKKGEALVVLHSCDMDEIVAERALRDRGLPALWIPKKYKRVKEIPILASGKLDLAMGRQLAGG
jgi:acyl-[acyl-carrier-protein]-phospholipid O-acyltransferase/long-chain-fatty-acid--[acyl-carrier-protein] ligase